MNTNKSMIVKSVSEEAAEIVAAWEKLKPQWQRAVLASSTMKGHDGGNPFVRSHYDHGFIITRYGSAHSPKMDKYAKNRSLGEFRGYAPVMESDRESCEGFFWGIYQGRTSPRRIKYEHRMNLKRALPGKSKRAITYAKRFTQARFLEWVCEEGVTGVHKTGCGSWKQFWREVKNGPSNKKPSSRITQKTLFKRNQFE